MSSHHIVRDEQEPALIVHQLKGFSSEVLGSLLEWSPTIVCCGSAVASMVDLGVKIDVAIVPFESRQLFQQLLEGQEPVKILSLSNPDYLSAGIQELLAGGHVAVNIITTEELYPEVLELSGKIWDLMQVCIWTSSSKYTVINSQRFKKWFPATSIVSFFTVEERASLAVYDSNGKDIDADQVRLTVDGIVKASCDRPPIIMVESIDNPS